MEANIKKEKKRDLVGEVMRGTWVIQVFYDTGGEMEQIRIELSGVHMAHGMSPAVSSSSPMPTDTADRSPGAGPGNTPIHWAPKYGAYPMFDQESRSSPHSFFARMKSSRSTSLAITASGFVVE